MKEYTSPEAQRMAKEAEEYQDKVNKHTSSKAREAAKDAQAAMFAGAERMENRYKARQQKKAELAEKSAKRSAIWAARWQRIRQLTSRK